MSTAATGTTLFLIYTRLNAILPILLFENFHFCSNAVFLTESERAMGHVIVSDCAGLEIHFFAQNCMHFLCRSRLGLCR